MSRLRLLGDAFAGVVDFLSPDLCHLCRRRHGPTGLAPPRGRFARELLAPVRTRLLGAPVTSHPFCPRCLSLLREPKRCGRLGGPGGPIAVVSPFYAVAALLEIVHLVKFRGYRCLLDPLAAALARAVVVHGAPAADVLVPVPMDPRSRRRRGFNQAEELARALSRRRGPGVEAGWIVKHRRTPPQSLTARERRRENVRDAFRATDAVPPGARVALVDDLVTSGATSLACAGALGAAGASVIAVLAVGRSRPEREPLGGAGAPFPHP